MLGPLVMEVRLGGIPGVLNEPPVPNWEETEGETDVTEGPMP